MELNKNYDFDDEGTEKFNTDINEDNITDTDNVNYLGSLPYSTNTRFNLLNGDDKYKPSTSKISLITENQTTENFLKEFDCFYAEMMCKVKGLKETSALKTSTFPPELNIHEEKLFKNLKHTPEVQKQLDNIQKLDEDINNVIIEYKAEKEERLQTQHEMCNEITKNNTLPERDTELFLNLCQFEFSDFGDDKKRNDEPAGEQKTKNSVENKPNDFIMRNIYLAKEGMFANSSLTDEEKSKLEELLQNENDCESPKKYVNPFTLPTSETTSNNAYKFTVDDNRKLDDIDSELEKFKLDEEKNEKDDDNKEENDEQNDADIKEQLEKLNNFMLEQRLKRLEAKLKTLRETEEKEMEKFEAKINTNQTEKPEDSEDEAIYIEQLTMIENSQGIENEIIDLNTMDERDRDDKEIEEMYQNIKRDKEIEEVYKKIMRKEDNEDDDETDEDIYYYNEQNKIQIPEEQVPEKDYTTDLSMTDDDVSTTDNNDG